MKTFAILAAAVTLLAAHAHAITITGANPGNLFAAGEPIRLTAITRHPSFRT